MKKIFLYNISILLLIACNNSPKADKAETSDQKEVAAATGVTYSTTGASLITWTGSKPTGSHTGTFTLKEGSFSVAENSLTGGSFLIDINSLQNVDLGADAENKGKLEGHLKSPDFFDAAKFPTAKFEITGVKPFVADSSMKEILLKDATHTISGNLTLKDSTKNITFPARITMDSATITASADFNIDRTLWGMNYKGPGNPQDWLINKQVNLKLALTANKK